MTATALVEVTARITVLPYIIALATHETQVLYRSRNDLLLDSWARMVPGNWSQSSVTGKNKTSGWYCYGHNNCIDGISNEVMKRLRSRINNSVEEKGP